MAKEGTKRGLPGVSSFQDHGERPRDDLHLGRQGTRLLPVDVEEDPLLRSSGHSRTRLHGNLADALDLPGVKFGEVPEDQRKVHCADHGHMEDAVVGHGVRGDQHAAAVISPVGDGDVEHIHRPLVPVVHLEADPLFTVDEQGDQCAPDEGDERPAGLARPVDPVHDLSAETEARDIMEVSAAHAALMVPEADAPEINRPDISLTNGLQGGPDPGRDGHGPAKVATGAVGEEAEDRILPDGASFVKEAVDHLVERAVAAHADDPVGALEKVFPGHPSGIARSFGQASFKGTQKVPGHFADPGPLFACRPVSRMRIHHEDGFSGIQVPPPAPLGRL